MATPPRITGTVVKGGALVLLSVLALTWVVYPILLPVEDLIIAATGDVLRLHSSRTIHLYLKRFRSIDPDHRTSTGLTLLQFTLAGFRRGQNAEINRRCLEVAELLIARGVPVDGVDNGQGMTALHHAIVQAEPEVVTFLLEHGASATLPVAGRSGKLAGKTPRELASLQLESGRLTAAEVATLDERLRAAKAP